jgi:myo-inositol-1(or 4)-monophosphatase
MTSADDRSDRYGELRGLAVELALAASAVHRQGRERAIEISIKSAPTDYVSDVDRLAEATIVERLALARPHDGVLAEEGSARPGDSGVRWIIDPLDGTMNYVYGYPAYCSSVAAEVDGEVAVAAVSETPTGNVFWAVRGGGAWQGDRRLAVRRQTDLGRALVGTGFSYDARQRTRQGAVIAHLLDKVADIRRGGAAALDLCRLAAAQLDAYFELDLSPWDYAAGRLIAREAGAEVQEMPAAHGKGPAVVGAGPELMPAFVALLRAAGAVS